MVRGRKAVAAKARMLQDLCRRTGQAHAMHWLDYLLTTPTALEKTPALVLVGLDPGLDPAHASADDLAGAVLLYEYKIAGRRTRVFATDDATGHRTVIAPANIRNQVAEEVCQALMNDGAVAVMITFEGSYGNSTAARKLTTASQIMTRVRSVPRYLPLEETVEATLSRLGRHTRRNLRYYRRRLEIEVGAEFVPEVDMGLDQYLAINRASTNPVSEALARWRYEAIRRTPGTLFAGVRTPKGRWLSLIGGRRLSGVTEIDWQINLAGLPRHSLSTVMRSYLLEHEIEIGTRKLEFAGGTPHPMRHSFVSIDAVDMIALRRSRLGWLLRKFARWVFPQKNFLGQALRDPQLPWAQG